MNRHIKAIAAFVSSVLALAVTFGYVSQETGAALQEHIGALIASAGAITATVWLSPRNED